MSGSVTFRPARPEDVRPAYAMFRRSIYDYLHRIGLVDAAAAADPPVETAWRRQEPWIRHFWETAAQNWVAEDAGGRLVGWALSLMRGGHAELAMFFVEPGTQSRGLGRGLLARALPEGRARPTTIVATQDARALALYLGSGVTFATTAVDLLMTGGGQEPGGDLAFEAVAPGNDGARRLALLDREFTGFDRIEDIRFLLSHRPAWIATRGGQAAGYAFGMQPNPPGVDDAEPAMGPMGAFAPEDVPALIDFALSRAPAGVKVNLSLPLSNRVAMAHALARGGRIDPFYVQILTSGDGFRADRYVHTSPSFIL